ncbi:hypothetical protein [Streptomyces sp. NBC_01237]|uniref:hypothetical protein n=1 Tax=Streptomyces sp. NBC_01237 TaxID=2903790 RepID=UPI002DD88B59|nr:hypothetical protein [Streptomyces sp. NBC_01237]WRZ71108.1 hypothetical protein OG251_05515 [Streptomyces sp. NBC_01237]
MGLLGCVVRIAEVFQVLQVLQVFRRRKGDGLLAERKAPALVAIDLANAHSFCHPYALAA